MNATHTQSAGSASHAGFPPAPSTTCQGADGAEYLLVITSSQFGRVEDPCRTLKEGVAAFLVMQQNATTGPVDQYGDIELVQLVSPAGELLRAVPRRG